MVEWKYEIRHAATGEAKNLPSKQAIADFLHERGETAEQWEGVACLGELPPPSADVQAPAEAAPAPKAKAPPKPKAPAAKKAAPAKKAGKRK